MRLLTYRLGRQHRPVVDRVDRVMDEAARLIAGRERHGLGTVEITVTATDGIPDLICAAHEQLFGRSDWDAWAGPGRYGVATLNPAGTLIVVNAQSLRGKQAEIDKTILHELTHAAQFNRPGARETARRGIAFNYGLGWLEDREVRALNRRIDRDEREAEQAERLHRQLAKSMA
ncbi:MAG: hypothetical protein HOV77_34635 [Hamadaea sp.]|uniref:hypothetical protein n=1 Tax=Hamadaea sp. TaxID=2024425 RepID=UPI001814CC33|nr:hypothetical protein [Hamadaea sp.]NUT24319.1 hypothetical protein [Hamadaea sp.]